MGRHTLAAGDASTRASRSTLDATALIAAYRAQNLETAPETLTEAAPDCGLAAVAEITVRWPAGLLTPAAFRTPFALKSPAAVTTPAAQTADLPLPQTADPPIADTAFSAPPAQNRDDNRDDNDPGSPPAGPPPVGKTPAITDAPQRQLVGARSAAAWEAALRPTRPSTGHRRQRRGEGATTLIASLTAELTAAGAGLTTATATRRHAVAVAHRKHAAAPAPRRAAPSLLAGLEWRLPARTPLYLAGIVALAVVGTDQAGGFASPSNDAPALAAPAGASSAISPAAPGTDSDPARALGNNRVSRSDRRSDLPAPAAVAAAGASEVVAPAPVALTPTPTPSPTSTMQPGQTVPGVWVRPNDGPYNSCFCARWGTFHEGIDLAGRLGSPILAVGDGKVIEAGPASGFGNWVVIQHANGDVSIYGHMRYYYVKVGQSVTAGQEIAVVGAEGNVTGPHLHLGIRQGGANGPYVDPVTWLAARGVAVGPYNPNA